MINKILRDSLDRGWVVTIIYQKGKEVTKRDIEVKSISSNRISAYCHLRNQDRVFITENILAADYCRRNQLPHN